MRGRLAENGRRPSPFPQGESMARRLSRSTMAWGNGVPNSRALFWTEAFGRLRATEARPGLAPDATKAFRRSKSVSDQERFVRRI